MFRLQSNAFCFVLPNNLQENFIKRPKKVNLNLGRCLKRVLILKNISVLSSFVAKND